MTASDEHAFRVIRAVVDGVDHAAREMESKWGVDRLRLLVPDELRVKFDSQREKFNRAVFGNDPDAVKLHGPAMTRAWQALDAAATAAGAKPLEPEVWETVTEDGEVIAITRTNWEAAAVTRQNRAMRVFTLAEVGRLLGGLPDLLAQTQQAFPGCRVEAVRVRSTFDEAHGDVLPI